MTPTDFADWMKRHGMNPNQAAAYLGIDRTTVDRYADEELEIPLRIALAAAALDPLKVYRLTPLDTSHNDWRASAADKMTNVRAQNEYLARWHAATKFHKAARRRSEMEETPSNPWLQPERVTCEEVADSSQLAAHGPPGIIWTP